MEPESWDETMLRGAFVIILTIGAPLLVLMWVIGKIARWLFPKWQ